MRLFKLIICLTTASLLACNNNAPQQKSEDSVEELEIHTPEFKYKKLNYNEEEEWIKELKSLEIPNKIFGSFKKKDVINVYYKYDTEVNGYTVTCRLIPFDKESETEYLIAKFVKEDTCFIYRNNERCNPHIFKIAKWENNDVYEFNYINPDFPDFEKQYNNNSPLGLHTPFQFYDINFDGENELIVNDFYRGKFGNNYYSYKINKNSLTPIYHETPFDKITSQTTIDPKKQQLSSFSCSGASYFVRFYFKKESYSARHIKEFDNPYNDYTREDIKEVIKKECEFSLDSVYEEIHTQNADSCYEYKRHGSKLKRVRSKYIKPLT